MSAGLIALAWLLGAGITTATYAYAGAAEGKAGWESELASGSLAIVLLWPFLLAIAVGGLAGEWARRRRESRHPTQSTPGGEQ